MLQSLSEKIAEVVFSNPAEENPPSNPASTGYVRKPAPVRIKPLPPKTKTPPKPGQKDKPEEIDKTPSTGPKPITTIINDKQKDFLTEKRYKLIKDRDEQQKKIDDSGDDAVKAGPFIRKKENLENDLRITERKLKTFNKCSCISDQLRKIVQIIQG